MTYELVAAEYYDPLLHPTCADFRTADLLAARKWMPRQREGVLVDVGCGKSTLLELDRTTEGTVVLVDRSVGMLSSTERQRRTDRIVADAIRMPFPDSSVDGIFAGLGDPYNSHELWAEMGRCLKAGGWYAFSTPSWEWCVRYRSGAGDSPDVATFVLQDGRRVLLPSHVYENDVQVEMIVKAGLAVEFVGEISRKEIEPVQSPKTRVLASEEPVLTWYAGRRV